MHLTKIFLFQNHPTVLKHDLFVLLWDHLQDSFLEFYETVRKAGEKAGVSKVAYRAVEINSLVFFNSHMLSKLVEYIFFHLFT